MRLSAVVALCCLCTIAFAADPAHASIRKDTNIPAEGLGPALETLAKDYDFQVLYRTEIVKNRKTQGAVGSLTSDEALTKVLSGTGLSYKYLDASTVTIIPVALVTTGAMTDQAQTSSNNTQDNSKEAGKKSSQDFRVAQVDQAPAGTQVAKDQTSKQGEPLITEVVVTAQKRVERAQDVPVPLTSIDAGKLTDSNQLRLEDYYNRVPALNLAVNEFGAPQLTIRGLTTGGFTNPTVAIVIDDVPFGSSTLAGYGEDAPDIDPSELARIEVLRGPQGTLYGASSLGGLVKYVTVDPSTEGVSGRVQAGADGVQNGSEVGYSFRGSVNVPLTDTAAIRASAFARLDPGYIDDPVLGRDGVNEGRTEGGRVSALWRPSEEVSVKLSALFQHSRLDGSSTVDLEPGLGDLQQSDARGSGGFDKKIQAYSATVSAKLGGVDLTSISGYNVNRLNDSFDYTPILGQLTQRVFGVTGTPLVNDLKTTKFSQEFRLSTHLSENLEWLLGAFYTHEDTQGPEYLLATDFMTGAQVGTWAQFIVPATYSEYAGFTDLTLHVTDRFDVQVGGRESEERQSSSSTTIGPYTALLGEPSPVILPEAHLKESAFTYLVTPRFKISPDLMTYARVASGYRPGGSNLTSVGGVPPNYGRDTTSNYEIGVKGTALDHVLSFDGSVYYIDWRDIQLSFFDPATGQPYRANGSRAKSEGVELSVEARPVNGLTFGAWTAWNDAELTKPLPAASTAYGASGDRLPYGSRFSGSLYFDHEFHLAGTYYGFWGGSLSYVGDRLGVFGTVQTPQRQTFPAYAKTDVRAGVRTGSWTANLYVNNLADRRGVLGGGIGTYNPAAFTYIPPRTVGLALEKAFW